MLLQEINNRYKYFVLSLISGILLWLAFPPIGWSFTLFVAFVPIFFLQDEIFQSKNTSTRLGNQKKTILFGWSFITFLIFNLLTTWWVKNAHITGVIAGSLFNSLLMSLSIYGFALIRQKMGDRVGFIGFVVVWLGVEFFHLNVSALDFPWLILGNAFSAHPAWVQWYEYTGVLGGSLWVLLANVTLYYWLKYQIIKFNLKEKEASKDEKKWLYWMSFRYGFRALLLILGVLLISYILYFQTDDKGKSVEIVILQPNIDPYDDKFDARSFSGQLEDFLTLAEQEITPKTRLLLMPETSIPGQIYFGRNNWQITRIERFLKKYPNLTLLAGATAFQIYSDEKSASKTARNAGNGMIYDVYNSALRLKAGEEMQKYYKSKLVIGVEKMPFMNYLSFLKDLIVDLGGTTGQLGFQENRTAFSFADSTGFAAPVICYESIFGQYVTDYIKEKSNLIAIITNDAWWGNTPGHKQHLAYARLRAIETRKSIARSANTGISAFINQRGDVEQATKYWKKTVIRGNVQLNPEITFYVRYGDYLGRFALIVAILLLLIARFKKVKKKV